MATRSHRLTEVDVLENLAVDRQLVVASVMWGRGRRVAVK